MCGEYRPLPFIAHSEAEFVQGATLFEALDALREHLAAWWGLVPQDCTGQSSSTSSRLGCHVDPGITGDRQHA